MRQDGWHFDDFVVELTINGEVYRCACSVKSFPVFGVKGAPAEFGAAAWKEWLGKGNSPFQRARDELAIFAAPHNPAIREAWQGLLDSARAGIPPETLARRQLEEAEPSALKRDAFASMRCPAEVDAASRPATRHNAQCDLNLMDGHSEYLRLNRFYLNQDPQDLWFEP